MATFNITLAHTITSFGCVEIEADSFEDAVEQIREAAETAPAEGIWDIHDVDYQHPCEQRIVCIEDESGCATVSDIALTHPERPWHILSADDVAAILAGELAT